MISSAILSLLVSHILTYVEGQLMKAEPEILQDIVNDVQSLINKLESLISSKSSTISSVANPVLNAIESAATISVEAAGQALVQNN